MEDADMPIGAEVDCADGKCGTTTCLVIDPSSEKVTHVVVKRNWFLAPQYLVPIEQVIETGPRLVRLCCTSAELEDMQLFVETEFIPMSGPTFGGGIFVMWPAAPSTIVAQLGDEHVPDGELVIHRHAHVQAIDGRIGQVEELLVDPQSGHISHLILQKGHLWGHKRVTIPIAEVDRVEGDTVYLKLDKRAVEAMLDASGASREK